MDFYWIYNLPNWLLGVLICTAVSGFSILGLLMSRRTVRRLMGREPAHNDSVSMYLSAIGVFYGITMGLIAVGAWDTFDAIKNQTDSEATTMAALYRAASTYEEPMRSTLQVKIANYNQFLVNEAWSNQRQGKTPAYGLKYIRDLQTTLYTYEPIAESQKIVHQVTISEFDQMAKLGRLRLQSVKTGLPAALWWVVILGALINILLVWLLVLEDIRVHIVLSLTMTLTMGLLIFLTAAMDNPFRGEFSISSDSFVEIYNQLMKKSS